jgi:hypothetical protein
MPSHPGTRVTACRKVYIVGLRIHHGLAGAAMLALGAVLVIHDRRDWPWPLIDR